MMYVIQAKNRDSNWVETLPTIYANWTRAIRELDRLEFDNPKNQYGLIGLDDFINYEK